MTGHRRGLTPAFVAATLLCALAPAAHSEESTVPPAPGSAALELLGANDLKVLRPGSVGALLSEGRTLMQDGKLAPGVGVEVSPWLWLGGSKDFEWVTQNPRAYNLYRSTVSAGNVADPLRAGAVRSAVAFRVQLWDETDWRFNGSAIRCHQQVVKPPDPTSAPPTGPAPPLTPDELDAIARCRQKDVRWNASQSSFGIGLVAASPDGQVTSLRGDAFHGWFGIGWGVGTAVGLVASGRYVYQRERSEPALPVPFLSPASHTAGGGLSGSVRVESFVAGLEGAAGWRHQQDDDAIKYAGTAYVMVAVARGTWIELRGEYAGVNDDGIWSGGGHLRWSFDPPR